MMSSLVIAIFLLSIGASFVQRTTGFGFGIFIMTMLPFFLPTYGEATILSGLLAITTSAVIVWRMILSKCVQSCPIVFYFPTQKFLKIFPKTSLGVIWPPVISARVSSAWRRSSLRRSPLSCIWRPSMTRWMLSWARTRAS